MYAAKNNEGKCTAECDGGREDEERAGKGRVGRERCGLSKNGERGIEEKYAAEGRVTQR